MPAETVGSLPRAQEDPTGRTADHTSPESPKTLSIYRAGMPVWWSPYEKPREWLFQKRNEQACSIVSINRSAGTALVEFLGESREPIRCLADVEDLRPRALPGRR